MIPEVYRKYKQFGSTDIQIRFRRLEEVQKGFEKEDRKRIEEVVDRFADFSATDLTILTQNQAPWNEAFGRKEKVIRCEDILEYFPKKKRKGEEKMKDITLWKCDICGTEYRDKKNSVRNAKVITKKEGKIVKMRHLSYTSDQSGYPDKITVKFEDGVEKMYSR